MPRRVQPFREQEAFVYLALFTVAFYGTLGFLIVRYLTSPLGG